MKESLEDRNPIPLWTLQLNRCAPERCSGSSWETRLCWDAKHTSLEVRFQNAFCRSRNGSRGPSEWDVIFIIYLLVVCHFVFFDLPAVCEAAHAQAHVTFCSLLIWRQTAEYAENLEHPKKSTCGRLQCCLCYQRRRVWSEVHPLALWWRVLTMKSHDPKVVMVTSAEGYRSRKWIGFRSLPCGEVHGWWGTAAISQVYKHESSLFTISLATVNAFCLKCHFSKCSTYKL